MKKSRRRKRKTGCVGGESCTRPRAVSVKYVPSFHFRQVCPYLSIDKGSENSHDSPQSVFGNHSCLDCRPYNNILHTSRAQRSTSRNHVQPSRRRTRRLCKPHTSHPVLRHPWREPTLHASLFLTNPTISLPVPTTQLCSRAQLDDQIGPGISC